VPVELLTVILLLTRPPLALAAEDDEDRDAAIAPDLADGLAVTFVWGGSDVQA
jgi:hypothetical protein